MGDSQLKKVAIAAAVLLAVAATAQTVKPIAAKWFQYAQLSSSPVPDGGAGTYFQTDSDMGSFVDVFPGGQRQAHGTGSGGASTLQGAYEGGNTVTGSGAEGTVTLTYPPDMGALTVTQNGCVMVDDNIDMGTRKQLENCKGLTLQNTTTVSGTGTDTTRPSPPLRLIGEVYSDSTSRDDEFRIYDNPLDNGSDDARLTFAHKINGSNEWREVLNIIHQYPFDETILNPGGRGALCAYLRGTESAGSRGSLPFWCLDETGTFKQGPSLSSTARWQAGTTGIAPEYNGQYMDLGGIVNSFSYVYSWHFRTVRDNIGASDPEAGNSIMLENGQPSTNGSVQHSMSSCYKSLGFNDTPAASPTYATTQTCMQEEPVQQTGAQSTSNLSFWQRNGGANRRVAALMSTQTNGGSADFTGGSFGVGSLEGMGATPSIASGAGSDCASSATISVAGAGNMGGTITVITGTAACGTGTIAIVTYPIPYDYLNWSGGYSGAPRSVVFFPANSAAAGASVYWDAGNSSTTVFKLASASALTAETQYKWSYQVIR